MASVKKVKSIKHISVDTPFEMKVERYVSVASNFASPFKYSNKYLVWFLLQKKIYNFYVI